MKSHRYLSTLITAVSATMLAGSLHAQTVVVWGSNNRDGILNPPASLTNAISVESGHTHCLALTYDNEVVAWGSNTKGESTPPPGLSNVVAVSAGARYSLALKSDGTVVGWGDNVAGQSIPPAWLSNVAAISCGSTHSLALLSNGTVVAWGSASYSSVPWLLTNVTAIAAGATHSMALCSNGRIVVWGDNSVGQCDIPARATNVVKIAAGARNSMAILQDGTVLVWGETRYGLCDVPESLNDVTEIAGGTMCCIARRMDGSVALWGSNSTIKANMPIDLPPVRSVGAGLDYVVVILGNPVIPSPTIKLHPLSCTANTGSTVRFRVVASGYPPLRYQWTFNGVSIPDQTNAVLVLEQVRSTAIGEYRVIVSNDGGSVVSDGASLSVVPALGLGMAAVVTINGEAGKSYHLDYINAVGPTNAWVRLTTITATSDNQIYVDLTSIGQPTRLYRVEEAQ